MKTLLRLFFIMAMTMVTNMGATAQEPQTQANPTPKVVLGKNNRTLIVTGIQKTDDGDVISVELPTTPATSNRIRQGRVSPAASITTVATAPIPTPTPSATPTPTPTATANQVLPTAVANSGFGGSQWWWALLFLLLPAAIVFGCWLIARGLANLLPRNLFGDLAAAIKQIPATTVDLKPGSIVLQPTIAAPEAVSPTSTNAPATVESQQTTNPVTVERVYQPISINNSPGATVICSGGDTAESGNPSTTHDLVVEHMDATAFVTVRQPRGNNSRR